MKKNKVAIIRGPGLSKWEMQIYESLIKWFEIIGIGSTKPINDCTNIKFPIKQLVCPGQYLSPIPKSLDFLFNLTGDTQWLLGFNQAVSGFDLLHAVELRSAYTVQAVRAKKKGLVKAITLTVYENIPFLSDQYPLRKKIKEEVIPEVDNFFAVNQSARQTLLAEGADNNRISIVPQSVDTSIFRPPKPSDNPELEKLRNKFKINKNDFIVTSVGRMVWEKGWYDIIRAAVKVKNNTSQKVKFLLVGSGPEQSHLQCLVNEIGLSDKVIFTGSLPYYKMPDIFRLTDIFVLASLPIKTWNEQFGGVLIEAMATGIPIIATLNGGIHGTVGQDGGIFVQPQDFSSLADAILTIMKDSPLKERISLRNRKIALERYDTYVVARQIKQIWDMVLESKK